MNDLKASSTASPRPTPRRGKVSSSSSLASASDLRPVPKTVDALLAEAEQYGLLGTSTSSSRKEKLRQPRGKLIGSVYQSWKVGRPVGHVFLMLLGDSGVGKSSTVNHLLNRQVADTSDSHSETHSTMEHILVAPDPNLAASDICLSIVDSPGFNDTDGLEQDARNLRCIDKFYQTHPSLMGKAYPNVIVVTLRATDTRYQGKHSCFMRCLRAVKRLKLVDHINPNIVVVVTWACSISSRAMTEKKSKIRNIILEVLHIETPVLCLENRPEDFDLEKIGDYTKLPDGTIQPKNLFDALIKMTQVAGDEFAQHCLSTHFDSDGVMGFDIKKGLSKPAKTSGLSDIEYDILVNLKEDFTDVQYIPEVAQMINTFIDTKSLTEEERNELNSIKYDLTDNLNVTSAKDINNYSLGQLCHLLKSPPSQAVEGYLNIIFKLKQDCVIPTPVYDLGKGFNALTDTLLTSSIFNLAVAEESLMETQFGTWLPPGVLMQHDHESVTYMESFTDESYVHHRLEQLHIDMQVDPRLFKMKARGGLNRLADTVDNDMSFLFEQRLFWLEVADWQDSIKEKVNRAFAADVHDLPEVFHKDENRGQFQGFFKTWGHFVVVGAYGGGSVDIGVSMKASGITIREKRLALEEMFKKLEIGKSTSGPDVDRRSQKIISSCGDLKWIGGESKYHVVSPVGITPELWRKWNESLAKHPSTLTMDMTLVPMHEVVGEIDQRKLKSCKNALLFFLAKEGKLQDLERLRMEMEISKQKEESRRVSSSILTRFPTTPSVPPRIPPRPLEQPLRPLRSYDPPERPQRPPDLPLRALNSHESPGRSPSPLEPPQRPIHSIHQPQKPPRPQPRHRKGHHYHDFGSDRRSGALGFGPRLEDLSEEQLWREMTRRRVAQRARPKRTKCILQ